MRQVTKEQLTRMKKRGGVKVKRRLGTGKLESDVKDSSVVSGIAKAETPAPASLPEAPPAVPDLQPMAAMAASLAARDAQLELVIENNTRVVKEFKNSLAEMSKPRKRVPWLHKINRTDKGLIDNVLSSPVEN